MDVSANRPTTARRFTLLDGMILVGAAAVGLAATHQFDPDGEWWEMGKNVASNFTWEWNLFDQLVPEMMFLAMPLAVTMTLGVLALRLRKPRPRRRWLASQPGFVACLALILGWGMAAVFTVGNVFSTESIIAVGTPLWKDPSSYANSFSLAGSLMGGFAVVVAWATQALLGHWRPQPGWPDRLGRLVGLAWIGMALAGWFVIRSGNL